jgi:phospholipid/cholesterol/gamma-HCH transport system permease protein
MEATSKNPDSTTKKKYLISKGIDGFFEDLYELYNFIIRFFKEAFSAPVEWKEIVNQCYAVGYKTLLLVSVTGFITGTVFTKQSRPSLSAFGASSWLPSLVSIAIIKTMAPLITALIAAGKVGSNIGAELGSMKVTEQIDAMEVSATNPFKFLVASRILATTFMMPVLVLYTALVGMMGAYLNVHANEATSFTSFFISAFKTIEFKDLFTSLFKAVCYGFTIGLAGCYQGYNAENGTQGVGRAANLAVVYSMFLIFVEELLIVQVLNSVK